MEITLIEANEILSTFDEKLRSYTERLIRKRKEMKIVQAAVTEVTETHVKLSNGETVPCGMVVWSTGLAPRLVSWCGDTVWCTIDVSVNTCTYI